MSEGNITLRAGSHSLLRTHRLSEGQQDLSAQNVEVVRRSGAVDDNPVTVVQLTYCKVLSHILAVTVEKTVRTEDIIII